LVDNIHIRMSRVLRVRKNAIEYAAGAAISRPSTVDSTLVMTEFFAYCR
jgi:hypothetical protein